MKLNRPDFSSLLFLSNLTSTYQSVLQDTCWTEKQLFTDLLSILIAINASSLKSELPSLPGQGSPDVTLLTGRGMLRQEVS